MLQTEYKLKPGKWKGGIATKADVDAIIILEGGMELSSGTMREEDLVPTFCDYLSGFEGFEGLIDEVMSLLNQLLGMQELPTYWENIAYQELEQELSYTLNESLFDALNDVAPDGYFFGSSMGDGSSYGFWKMEEF
jgi:hypothetical protein